jgi:glycosyltransferase involved in cell wall biosynthesis
VANAVHLPPEVPDRRPREAAPCIILYAGALSRRKGTHDLLAAAARLRDRAARPFRIILAGPFAEDLSQRECERLIRQTACESGVEHIGSVDAEECQALYRQADVFVLPSHSEVMPMAVLEAMSYALPVVASRVGAVPVLTAGDAGLLVEPEDVEGLASALHRLVDDPRLRRQMGARARRRVEDCFRDVRFADDLERVYRRILPRRWSIAAAWRASVRTAAVDPGGVQR